MTKYNTIRHLEVKALRAKGMEFKDIASALGMSKNTAYALCRYRPTGRKKGERRSTEHRDTVQKLRDQGLTLEEIGRQVGRSRQAVQQLLTYKPANEFLLRHDPLGGAK